MQLISGINYLHEKKIAHRYYKMRFKTIKFINVIFDFGLSNTYENNE